MRRGALFWALVALTAVVYGTMVFWSLPRIAEAAGGLMPFDLRPGGYTHAEAARFLAALDDEARAFYLGVQQRLDLAFPALLGLTLGWATLWAFAGIGALRCLLLLPAAASAVFDWIENARVAALLRAEAVDVGAVQAASSATVAKSVAVTLAMTILLAGLAWRGWRGWRGAA